MNILRLNWILLSLSIAFFSCSPAKMGARDFRSQPGGPPPPSPIKKLNFPQINSQPVLKIGAGLTYNYRITFASPPPFPIELHLVKAPENMTLDKNGQVSWKTSQDVIGYHQIGIEAREKGNSNNKVEQGFKLQVTEYCDLERPALALFLDQNLDGNTDGDKIITLATPFKGPLSAIDNYGYKWWTPNIQHGPRGDFYSSTTFFYEGSDGLFFFSLFDKDGGGAIANSIKTQVLIDNNDYADSIIFSDDPNDGWWNSPLKREITPRGHSYSGKLMNWFRADGFVIGPILLNPAFNLVFSLSKPGNLRFSRFHRFDGSPEGRQFSLPTPLRDEGPWPQIIFALSDKAPCE